MSTIGDLEQGKVSTVRIKRSADGSFQIASLDQTEESVAAFRALAEKVIVEAKGLRREVMTHKSSRTGDYDTVVIYPAK